jgi:cell division transport system permease protein
MIFQRPDLPLDRDSSSRFLPGIIAIMVYLASLALALGFAMNKLAERWDSGLSSEMTIQIPLPPEAAGSPDADSLQAKRVADVIAALQDVPGVRAARPLEEQEVLALLEPWLGDVGLVTDLPIPQLIALEVDPDDRPNPADLQRRLDEAAPGALIDDHQAWLDNLKRFARTLQAVAYLVVLLVLTAAVITVIFLTLMGLAAHRQVIELLHLIGAQDAYVARQFQNHALKLGLLGALLGLALAAGTIFGLANLFSDEFARAYPDIALTPLNWMILLLLPLVISLIIMLCARFTVLLTLARMP